MNLKDRMNLIIESNIKSEICKIISLNEIKQILKNKKLNENQYDKLYNFYAELKNENYTKDSLISKLDKLFPELNENYGTQEPLFAGNTMVASVGATVVNNPEDDATVIKTNLSIEQEKNEIETLLGLGVLNQILRTFNLDKDSCSKLDGYYRMKGIIPDSIINSGNKDAKYEWMLQRLKVIFMPISEQENINEDIKKYPELTKIAKDMSNEVARDINDKVKNVKSEMPYKAQFVLEELIKFLEEKV